jgi:hypothetical protein
MTPGGISMNMVLELRACRLKNKQIYPNDTIVEVNRRGADYGQKRIAGNPALSGMHEGRKRQIDTVQGIPGLSAMIAAASYRSLRIFCNADFPGRSVAVFSTRRPPHSSSST